MINWGIFADKITPTRKQLEKADAQIALQRTHVHIYEGTANQKALAKRRAKDKVAKRSRKINRRS
jgi:hypothetical protein